MEKFNKNSIIFIFAILFIACGIWGGFSERMVSATSAFFSAVKTGNNNAFTEYRDEVDDISNSALGYHSELMEVNALKENALGTRVVQKDGATVIKGEDDQLLSPAEELVPKADIDAAVASVAALKEVSEKCGAKFLYCAAPDKECYFSAPANVKNYNKENYDAFLKAVDEADIPYLDLAAALGDKCEFYRTDHHWTARSGFFATAAIVNALNVRYGFAFNEQYSDINNYNAESYKNWFLGSKGKKVGEYFTWNGADDFELITPKFDTSLTESQPFKNSVRSGSFKDTVLYMGNMKKDYYNINAYATYSGGDFRLQTVKNSLAPDGKKIFIIRDSFACAVTPFLSLQTSELHICDMRSYAYYVGDKINAGEYIKEINPDYVLVLYSGITTTEESVDRYNFF